MKRHFENLTARASRIIAKWWLLLIAGILYVIAGICVFAFPIESYVTLAVLFGILMLLPGAAQLIISSTSGNYLMMKGYENYNSSLGTQFRTIKLNIFQHWQKE